MTSLDAITVTANDDGTAEVEVPPPSVLEQLTTYRALPERPKAPRMILPNVIQHGLTVLASYPGTGKTTAVVSLALVVCGAYRHPQLPITDRRHVVYLSEHPEQIEGIISAMTTAGLIDKATVTEWFHLVDTRRVDPRDLPPIAKSWADDFTYSLTRNDTTVEWKPWVVVDTAPSTLAIENENDNSEWSAAIAVLKQDCANLPILLVAHTSKAHKHGEAKDMTVRGASSIEGDANQVIVLAKDEAENRYLEITGPKHRFETPVEAIKLDSAIEQVQTLNEFNELLQTDTRYVTLEPLTRDDREAIKEAQASAELAQKTLQIGEALKTIIPKLWEAKALPHKEALVNGCKDQQIKARKESYATILNELCEDMLTFYDKGDLAELKPMLKELGFPAPHKNCAGIYALKESDPVAELLAEIEDQNVPDEPECLSEPEAETAPPEGDESGEI